LHAASAAVPGDGAQLMSKNPAANFTA